MKKILYKGILCASLAFGFVSCQDFEEVNKNPNYPEQVYSNMLMGGTEARIMYYVYDNWFSGRQCLTYSQYWCQRNYTEEDRYQIRESTNNNYFNYLYQGVAGLKQIIDINTDPETASAMAIYGANVNQIAAAKVLRVWLFQLMSDTWGSIPYFEASKVQEGIYYPKYDDQKVIYQELIKELTEAANAFDVSEPSFIGGERIYDGDTQKWKRFANSLKCRIAIRLSKVDPNWKKYIYEAIESGVFESNKDNAGYQYSTTAPEETRFYRGFFVDKRNDFTISRPFVDILKGQPDTLNKKAHPWEGVTDPRLPIYTTSRGGNYIGMPLGIPSNTVSSTMRNTAPSWYSLTNHPLCLNPDFTVTLMSYAELQFILSEYNGFSEAEYKHGVQASLEYWSSLNAVNLSSSEIEEYVKNVSKTVNAESVALQKYIDLYMNGTEAWAEYRRTGYPTQLLKPNEISCISATGEELMFTPLSETKGDIIARVKYPTNESSLNGSSFEEAILKLQDGTNNYYSKMFWDVRSAANPHPTNK